MEDSLISGGMIGYASSQGSVKGASIKSPTLLENIDSRIAQLKSHAERLERVKQLLQEPGGILNVPIEDLRFAMSY